MKTFLAFLLRCLIWFGNLFGHQLKFTADEVEDMGAAVLRHQPPVEPEPEPIPAFQQAKPKAPAKTVYKKGSKAKEVGKYLHKYLRATKVGDVVFVPLAPTGILTDFTMLQSRISTYGVQNWGAGAMLTKRDRVRGGVEVMRVK